MMTYKISGLSPDLFVPLFAMDDAELAANKARRITATADRGWPCRISLEDAKAGEELILLHHVSHDVETPFRSAYAIYVRQGVETATFCDALPPAFAGRTMAFRGFGDDGMLVAAKLVPGEDGDAAIRSLFADPAIAYIHAQYATNGCFAARIERDEP
ncbi:hypothetical protein Sala_2283 [Sphingopyxis alaskensis RB2256]|jgi:hypothetical protein|uniref:DUF1203 domain-containing protein n=2 Tax=Sphingopyxis alaskensis TaxID=117207 RepID=Q1GQT0_SPHAL|nr:hypothetical protein Sala_2283 [Sphingopyxis alaskensis RB2256]